VRIARHPGTVASYGPPEPDLAVVAGHDSI